MTWNMIPSIAERQALPFPFPTSTRPSLGSQAPGKTTPSGVHTLQRRRSATIQLPPPSASLSAIPSLQITPPASGRTNPSELVPEASICPCGFLDQPLHHLLYYCDRFDFCRRKYRHRFDLTLPDAALFSNADNLDSSADFLDDLESPLNPRMEHSLLTSAETTPTSADPNVV